MICGFFKKVLLLIAVTISAVAAYADDAADSNKKSFIYNMDHSYGDSTTKGVYPNVSGTVLLEAKADRATSSKEGVKSFNSFANAEAKMALNLNRNWSLRTKWRLNPILDRDTDYQEKTRYILSNRKIHGGDNGLIVEELKLNFQNDDARFYAGKFNPIFGAMHRKAKRIGVFTTDFTRDYELREKIGFGVDGLLENSEISASSFFADTTALSNSAFTKRGSDNNNNGIASNTKNLNSYTIAMEGSNPLDADEKWHYNIGYRKLAVGGNNSNYADEHGYVFGSEYLYEVGEKSSLIPMVEIVKLKNFTGVRSRNATYITTALMGVYSRWTASAALIKRDINNNLSLGKTHDKLLQYSVGYKFTDRFAVDVSRANVKESGVSAPILGVMLSYLYQF